MDLSTIKSSSQAGECFVLDDFLVKIGEVEIEELLGGYGDANELEG